MHSLTKFTAILALATIPLTSIAAERGSLDEAKALVQKAKAYLKANGPEKSYAAFSDPKGSFVDRDLYIYVYDKELKNLAHGGNQKLIGKNLSDMRDADGNYFNQGLLKAAMSGGGTYTFKFLNPSTQQIEKKTGYAEMVGDVMVGSGAYAGN
ncbi:cache domain-containing protein [Noviherbaspirillum galbum]|uniref:Histidine kinase n=1 Tax=Noviherbaspirillum galbum TaxID=2709383 RepID=A0A6B3SN76_9BURK|nr:cache domain-containing protein [Noviherbaspirillum galbum]NEX62213.1 histidine kinase [Noviherbaspirillum galbum]